MECPVEGLKDELGEKRQEISRLANYLEEGMSVRNISYGISILRQRQVKLVKDMLKQTVIVKVNYSQLKKLFKKVFGIILQHAKKQKANEIKNFYMGFE